ALRYGDDIIVVDAGMMFPDSELLGVDIVTPDFTYLEQHASMVRGLILTHGHEDHIGGVPFLLSQLNIPVYGTEFTLKLVERRLDEHEMLKDASLHVIRAGERIRLGPFEIDFIRVTHSIVSCVALAITTPLGVVIHTGDFKVDPTPTDNRLFDLHAFAEYGKTGVLALFQDSTNVERTGYTPSERAVRRKFDEVFAHTKRRLFISCFSSSIHRIKLVVEMAWQHGRKVAFAGRSMNNSAEIAEDLGYIEIPEGLLIHPGEMKNFPPEKVCVLISGTQGEPMSALSRAAVDNHKHAKIEKGDTVMLSSRIIPGNEKAIYRMIDHLFRREAHVIYDDGSSPPVHVSGHASQEELKLIINLVKPRYFIPIHGEYRQLKLHAEMAAAMKGSVGNVMLIESGDILEFDELGARKAGRVNVGRVCIDSGSRTDVVEDLIVKDRRHLSEDGIVLPIIAINKLTGKVETSPEIVTRGFSPGEDGFDEGARQIVMQTLDASSAEEKA
ncbi:MAG: ribonuclease J, partial [Terriglobia bacterium]